MASTEQGTLGPSPRGPRAPAPPAWGPSVTCEQRRVLETWGERNEKMRRPFRCGPGALRREEHGLGPLPGNSRSCSCNPVGRPAAELPSVSTCPVLAPSHLARPELTLRLLYFHSHQQLRQQQHPDLRAHGLLSRRVAPPLLPPAPGPGRGAPCGRERDGTTWPRPSPRLASLGPRALGNIGRPLQAGGTSLEPLLVPGPHPHPLIRPRNQCTQTAPFLSATLGSWLPPCLPTALPTTPSRKAQGPGPQPGLS